MVAGTTISVAAGRCRSSRRRREPTSTVSRSWPACRCRSSAWGRRATRPSSWSPDHPMKVLLIGKGGREHALAVSLKASNEVSRLYAAPGNPGIGEVAELVELADTSPAAIADAAEALGVDLVVVGPED